MSLGVKQTALPLGLAVALASLPTTAAWADYHIRSPMEIDQGELELEHNGAAGFDRNPELRGGRAYTAEIGTGPTSWWHTEAELGFGREPGPDQPTQLQEVVWENMVRLTEPGEYWATFGLYGEYAQTTLGHTPNDVLFGPLVTKDIGRTSHTLNLFLDRQVGPNNDNHSFNFSYAWQSRWNVWAPLSPAVEIYGEAGPIDHLPKFADQQFLVGPVAIGALPLPTGGRFKYELGWLFGATPATASGTLRWRMELELPF
jgi:hypothetical protein